MGRGAFKEIEMGNQLKQAMLAAGAHKIKVRRTRQFKTPCQPPPYKGQPAGPKQTNSCHWIHEEWPA